MAVCSDIFLFSFCLLDTGFLIFVLIYFIITLSDLECDYLNAQECCGKLNFVRTFYDIFANSNISAFQWNVPKIWTQYLMSFLLLICGHWLLFGLNLPICIYLGKRYGQISRLFLKKMNLFFNKLDSSWYPEEIWENTILPKFITTAR